MRSEIAWISASVGMAIGLPTRTEITLLIITSVIIVDIGRYLMGILIQSAMG